MHFNRGGQPAFGIMRTTPSAQDAMNGGDVHRGTRHHVPLVHSLPHSQAVLSVPAAGGAPYTVPLFQLAT